MKTPPLLNALYAPGASLSSLLQSRFAGHAETAPLVFNTGDPVPDRLATEVACFFTDDSLYVCFAGSFERLRLAPAGAPFAPSGKTMHLWELSDVFEVFIGPEARSTRRYKEFQASPDGRWIDIDVLNEPDRRADYDWISGMTTASEVDTAQRRWYCVFAVPWTAFGGALGELDCNFYRATGAFHGDELLAWSPPGTGPRCFHRPEFFGTLRCRR